MDAGDELHSLGVIYPGRQVKVLCQQGNLVTGGHHLAEQHGPDGLGRQRCHEVRRAGQRDPAGRHRGRHRDGYRRTG